MSSLSSEPPIPDHIGMTRNTATSLTLVAPADLRNSNYPSFNKHCPNFHFHVVKVNLRPEPRQLAAANSAIVIICVAPECLSSTCLAIAR
jgi:hypothetical protein